MTAEIAILNKTAVALATDSAVTISAGSYQQKIYDSADKLFDLCGPTPIGVMIYNGMQFMQTPLPMLIADYRAQQNKFERLPQAASALLTFLCAWGCSAPNAIADASLANIVCSTLAMIKNRAQSKFQEAIQFDTSPEEMTKALGSALEEAITLYERLLARAPDALFVDRKGNPGAPRITQDRRKKIKEIVSEEFRGEGDPNIERLTEIGCNAILKNRLSGAQTGIVVAGFGSKDIFPTLVSFEVDGMAFGRLKYVQTNSVDIDRAGDRARVLPFAQKEMVERFLYGLDGDMERSITQYCKNTVPAISDEIFAQLDMSDADMAILKTKARAAEDAFVKDLQQKRFSDIRSQSKSAIEDMVEFMPKPELATMAEALVNLTSIKRKVSRGMETVGGPIDVAVISRSDGFIWVKRKHYFSTELNPRYGNRVRMTQWSEWENRRETEHARSASGKKR